MPRTSTAVANNFLCPQCGDGLRQDLAGRGFVAHRTNKICQFEQGEKDDNATRPAVERAVKRERISLRDAPLTGASMSRIHRLVERVTTSHRVMQPTTVFNEGWLLRLALDWFAENPAVSHAIGVPEGTRWFSEAMLPTQFSKNAVTRTLSESYTRADGSIGHIKIGRNGEGDLTLMPHAEHFVVAEAKLNSRLSQGVKHASYYDQAARNVACMAKVLSDSGTRPESLSQLAFVVIAPATQIAKGTYASQLTKTSLGEKVARRVHEYDDPQHERWLDEWFTPMLEKITITEISWESVTAVIQGADGLPEPWFEEFYQRCLEYNRLAGK